MMLKTLFIGFLLAALVPDEGVLRAVLFLTGAADAEQLDECKERHDELQLQRVQ